VKRKRKRLLIRFAEALLRQLERAQVRRFGRKHSPRKYNEWAHAVLLSFKQLFDKSYRFVMEQIALMTPLLTLLKIPQAPHFTTLQKASKRFEGTLIERVISSFVSSTKSQSVRYGIDSTGFQATRCSSYYTTVISRQRKHRRRIKRHIKLSTVVDLDHQLPATFKIRRGPASDHRDSENLMLKTKSIKPAKSMDGDKGYDSEKNHRTVVEELNAEDRIKVKNKEVPIHRTRGTYRKARKRRTLRANYRSLCETYHSQKRVVGSNVRAIKVKSQNQEVRFKILTISALRAIGGILCGNFSTVLLIS
jgi:transposase